MNVQDYILSTVEALRAPIAMEDIGNTPLEEAIYARVMSKKFRKLKAADEAMTIARRAIHLAVKDDKPIRIFQMFGGNKLWRFEEAPEIDWAELFSLTYFVQWCRHIASVYKPGVIFEYFSQDVSVESLNNVSRSETDKYSQTFRQMLRWIEPYLPPNIKVVYTRHYELFADPLDYDKEIQMAKQAILEKNGGTLPEMTEAMKLATELNVKLKPDQDTDPDWREKVELEHQAIFQTKTLRMYSDAPDILWTCPTFFSDSVVTGSTKHSMAKFWAGVGALRPRGDRYDELVLTPKQLEAADFTWEKVNIPGLKGKNFARVRVLQ